MNQRIHTIAQLLAILLLTGCDSVKEEDRFTNRFGSVQEELVVEFMTRLDAANIEYRTTIDVRGLDRITFVSWKDSDDSSARVILCDTFPAPPPHDRSVSLLRQEDRELLEGELIRAGIEVERVEFANSEVLIWSKEDAPTAQQIFLQTFGHPIYVPPSSESYRRRMGCNE